MSRFIPRSWGTMLVARLFVWKEWERCIRRWNSGRSLRDTIADCPIEKKRKKKATRLSAIVVFLVFNFEYFSLVVQMNGRLPKTRFNHFLLWRYAHEPNVNATRNLHHLDLTFFFFSLFFFFKKILKNEIKKWNRTDERQQIYLSPEIRITLKRMIQERSYWINLFVFNQLIFFFTSFHFLPHPPTKKNKFSSFWLVVAPSFSFS